MTPRPDIQLSTVAMPTVAGPIMANRGIVLFSKILIIELVITSFQVAKIKVTNSRKLTTDRTSIHTEPVITSFRVIHRQVMDHKLVPANLSSVLIKQVITSFQEELVLEKSGQERRTNLWIEFTPGILKDIPASNISLTKAGSDQLV